MRFLPFLTVKSPSLTNVIFGTRFDPFLAIGFSCGIDGRLLIFDRRIELDRLEFSSVRFNCESEN
jgi:hypothetical protein